MDIYEKFKQTSGSERLFIANKPDTAPVIYSASEEAISETRRIFGDNGHNDISDAFRHCYFAAILSRYLGYYDAMTYLKAHEDFPGNPPNEKRMDMRNNYIGADIGQTQKRNNELSALCLQAALGGKLANF